MRKGCGASWKRACSWLAFIVFVAICLRVPRTLHNKFFTSLLRSGSNYYEDSCHFLRIDWLCKNNAYLAFSIPAFWGISSLVISQTSRRLFFSLLTFTIFAIAQLYMSANDVESGYMVQLMQSMVRMVQGFFKLLLIGVVTFDIQYMGKVMHFVQPLFHAVSSGFQQSSVSDALLVGYGLVGILVAGWRVKSYVHSIVSNGLFYTITCTMFSNAIIGLLGYAFDDAQYKFLHLACFWICDSLRDYPTVRTALASRLQRLHKVAFRFAILILTIALTYYTSVYFGITSVPEQSHDVEPLCFQTGLLNAALSGRSGLKNYATYLLRTLKLLLHSVTQTSDPHHFGTLILVCSILIINSIPLTALIVTFSLLTSSKYAKPLSNFFQSSVVQKFVQSTLSAHPSIVNVTHGTDALLYNSVFSKHLPLTPGADNASHDDNGIDTVLIAPPLDLFHSTYVPPYTTYFFLLAVLGLFFLWAGPSLSTKGKRILRPSGKSDPSLKRSVAALVKSSALLLSCCFYFFVFLSPLANYLSGAAASMYEALPSSLHALIVRLSSTRFFQLLERAFLYGLEKNEEYFATVARTPLSAAVCVLMMLCILCLEPPTKLPFRFLYRITCFVIGLTILASWVYEMKFAQVEFWGVLIDSGASRVKACIGFEKQSTPPSSLLQLLKDLDHTTTLNYLLCLGLGGYLVHKLDTWFLQWNIVNTVPSQSQEPTKLKKMVPTTNKLKSKNSRICCRKGPKEPHNTPFNPRATTVPRGGDDSPHSLPREDSRSTSRSRSSSSQSLSSVSSAHSNTRVVTARPAGKFSLQLGASDAGTVSTEQSSLGTVFSTWTSVVTGLVRNLGSVFRKRPSTSDEKAADSEERGPLSRRSSDTDHSDSDAESETMQRNDAWDRGGFDFDTKRSTSGANALNALRRRGRRGSQVQSDAADSVIFESAQSSDFLRINDLARGMSSISKSSSITQSHSETNVGRPRVFMSSLYSQPSTSTAESPSMQSSATSLDSPFCTQDRSEVAQRTMHQRNRRGSVLASGPSPLQSFQTTSSSNSLSRLGGGGGVDMDRLARGSEERTWQPPKQETPQERPGYSFSSLLNRVLPPSSVTTSTTLAIPEPEPRRPTPSSDPTDSYSMSSFAMGSSELVPRAPTAPNAPSHIRTESPAPISTGSTGLSRLQQFLISATSLEDQEESPSFRPSMPRSPAEPQSATFGSFGASQQFALSTSWQQQQQQQQLGTPTAAQPIVNVEIQRQSFQLSSPLLNEPNFLRSGSFGSLQNSRTFTSPHATEVALPGQIPQSQRSTFPPAEQRPTFARLFSGGGASESPSYDRMHEDDEDISASNYHLPARHEHESVRPKLTLPGVGQSHFSTAFRR